MIPLKTSIMSESHIQAMRKSIASLYSIPSGRQLPRTPPVAEVRRCLDLDVNTDNIQHETGQETQPEDPTHTLCVSPEDIKPIIAENQDTLLKGMKGYQLTSNDLEYIETMKRDKVLKKMQDQLVELERLMGSESMALELSLACKEKTDAELNKLPSSDELCEWLKATLEVKSPSMNVEDLSSAALFTMVTKSDVKKATDAKRTENKLLQKTLSEKRKREVQEEEQLERQIASNKAKLQPLMGQLTELKCQLAGLQKHQKLEQHTTDLEHQRTGRKNVVVSEKNPKVRQTRLNSKGESSEGQSSLEGATGEPNRGLKKVKAKPEEIKSTKHSNTARDLQMVPEESNLTEYVQQSDGIRKTAGSTRSKVPQPNKNPGKMKDSVPLRSRLGAAESSTPEKEQNSALRRSRRIASRK